MSRNKRLAHWFSLIRTRLTLWIIVMLAVGLLAFVVTTLLIAQGLLDHLDQKRLQQSVTALAVGLNQQPQLSPTQVRSQLDAFSVDENYFQYQDAQGNPIASSTSLGSRVLPRAELKNAITSGQLVFLTLDNRRFYLSGRIITANGKLYGYLIGARAIGDTESEARLFILMYGGVFTMLTIIAVLVWLLVRRTLHPLELLASSASRIAQTRDHALRVHVQERPDEINSLAQTINGMLHSLEEAYQHMQKVNDLQRRFLADASHEMRTPLTIMLSSLELLKKDEGRDPEFQSNALENIYGETQRMARLTNQLLMLARTDSSSPVVHHPLLIVDIINETFSQSCPSNRDIAMESHGLETLDDAVVYGNPDYLKQVFLILLENACKYTPDGGTVTLRGTKKARNLIVSITDTGIGIAQDDLTRIFERFYRAPNANGQPGTGLGLSIALSIAEQHGGTIKVESRPEQGSTFTVFLPLLDE